MTTRAFYESQAARCREYAAKSRDADTIKRWLQLALEYEQLAETMASGSQVTRGAPPVQQPETQQQQSKTKPTEGE